ncbi:MAG: hypothetical protein R3F42_08530 [Pseudomonadota bacterium]
MKVKHYMQFVIGITVILLGMSGARAASVVYEDFGVVTDDTVFSTPFEVTTPGTYRAELVDFEFSAPFDILALAVTQGITPLGFGFDTGAFTFNVSTPGTLYAHLAAIPLAGQIGTYALQIKAIPIPPAGLLLFSGLIGLAVVGRRDSRVKSA